MAFKFVKARFFDKSIFVTVLLLKFNEFNKTKSAIPVRSAISLFETSKSVTAAILIVATFPFLPSMSILRAISLSSNLVSGIVV
ncbi:hypothetical protein D3C80_1593660 [compost metagenome]